MSQVKRNSPMRLNGGKQLHSIRGPTVKLLMTNAKSMDMRKGLQVNCGTMKILNQYGDIFSCFFHFKLFGVAYLL